ncbi:GNAT family N-acetyltransferase [Clostridium beijerinckii]|uniref:GNAT superfamily N-acetyltransferase n=1 Tax=Clostridium beijerinckii TaxID=1520 RepID=A0AAX0BAV2_CLOBE|nr:GNAT family N-acetyltransferase [Clostridium beijerinckii]NRT92076.1 GNAT superfamily N-acetyltransferase [Clostridium beijerinckii]NYC71603.1 GNAT superfamily N-acetyltransferase [Clostridium beijerinckii]
MFFKAKDFYVDLVENKDLSEVTKVYNSNRDFLISHMDKEEITAEWILQELNLMKAAGFYSCKIVEIRSGNIVGIIDFKIGKETYLSLFILHNDFKGKGFGKLIFKSFEEYVKSLKSKFIRIDVVINYNNSILCFWIKNGFVKVNDVKLNWTGKVLPAIIMKKSL